MLKDADLMDSAYSSNIGISYFDDLYDRVKPNSCSF